MSNATLTEPDPVHLAQLRLLAARTDYRDALDEQQRAREVLLQADLAYRRLVDGLGDLLEH